MMNITDIFLSRRKTFIITICMAFIFIVVILCRLYYPYKNINNDNIQKLNDIKFSNMLILYIITTPNKQYDVSRVYAIYANAYNEDLLDENDLPKLTRKIQIACRQDKSLEMNATEINKITAFRHDFLKIANKYFEVPDMELYRGRLPGQTFDALYSLAEIINNIKQKDIRIYHYNELKIIIKSNIELQNSLNDAKNETKNVKHDNIISIIISIIGILFSPLIQCLQFIIKKYRENKNKMKNTFKAICVILVSSTCVLLMYVLSANAMNFYDFENSSDKQFMEIEKKYNVMSDEDVAKEFNKLLERAKDENKNLPNIQQKPFSIDDFNKFLAKVKERNEKRRLRATRRPASNWLTLIPYVVKKDAGQYLYDLTGKSRPTNEILLSALACMSKGKYDISCVLLNEILNQVNYKLGYKNILSIRVMSYLGNALMMAEFDTAAKNILSSAFEIRNKNNIYGIYSYLIAEYLGDLYAKQEQFKQAEFYYNDSYNDSLKNNKNNEIIARIKTKLDLAKNNLPKHKITE